MKQFLITISQRYAFVLLAGFVSVATAHADGISVPGDFPNSFAMNLQGGTVFIDGAGSNGALVTQSTFAPNGHSILFQASAFDGVGPGAGTSQLTLQSFNHWDIGTVDIYGTAVDLYIDGPGTGTLVDNANSTAGNWTLQVPLYATYDGFNYFFSDFTLTTAATYQYHGSTTAGLPETSISGTAMNYATGDAYLVGQSTSGFDNSPFSGFRLTIGLTANDPVVVPLPPSAYLFGTSIVLLFGLARRRTENEKNRSI